MESGRKEENLNRKILEKFSELDRCRELFKSLVKKNPDIELHGTGSFLTLIKGITFLLQEKTNELLNKNKGIK